MSRQGVVIWIFELTDSLAEDLRLDQHGDRDVHKQANSSQPVPGAERHVLTEHAGHSAAFEIV